MWAVNCRRIKHKANFEILEYMSIQLPKLGHIIEEMKWTLRQIYQEQVIA